MGEHTTVPRKKARAAIHQDQQGSALQHTAVNDAAISDVPSSVHDTLHSPGETLDADTRTIMEPRLGHDFSNVRVHTDAKASESAREVNALAYTVGRDVVFNEGQFAPGTVAGKQLLAHELTHVVQQGGHVVPNNSDLKLSHPSDPDEQDAEFASRIITEQTLAASHRFSLPERAFQRQVFKNSLRHSMPQIQRQQSQERQPKSGVQAQIAIDPISRIIGYLRGQIQNWGEGARQATTEFREVVKKKEEKNYWIQLVKDLSVFLLKKAATGVKEAAEEAIGAMTFGLAEVGAEVLEDYVSEKIAKSDPSASADKMYHEFLIGINNAQTAMMDEQRLQNIAHAAISKPAIASAFQREDVHYWTTHVRELAGVPEGDIEKIKRDVLAAHLKKYISINITEVQVEFAAEQGIEHGPSSISTTLQNWPELARLIQRSDTTWHIYKDKTIVGIQGGVRQVIPVNHPKRAVIEDYLKKYEAQALKEEKTEGE